MRYLGIDFGTKKVGLAMSDESGTMAFPKEVIPNDAALLSVISSLIEREQIGAVVIGHSHANNGLDNPVQEAINEFITDLTLQVPIPVHLEPEFYSTQEAKRLQGKTVHTDAAAAAIILNSFLAKQSN